MHAWASLCTPKLSALCASAFRRMILYSYASRLWLQQQLETTQRVWHFAYLRCGEQARVDTLLLPYARTSRRGASRQACIASLNASTSPAGTSQPCSPECTSSGMPPTNVLMTGRLSAIASIITTGRPSEKLGSTSARAARISSRTCSLLGPSCDTHIRLQVIPNNQCLNIGAQFAVADKNQLKTRASALQDVAQPPSAEAALFLGSTGPHK